MIKNYFTIEKNEQHPASPSLDKTKKHWHSPRLTLLKGSNTETNEGFGPDGGLEFNSAS
jgi:hypothetical protein